MKYLVLFAILAVIYLVWRARQRARQSPRPDAQAAAPRSLEQQDMVRCPVCAVHLPRGEAVADPQGRLFCSHDHRDSARR